MVRIQKTIFSQEEEVYLSLLATLARFQKREKLFKMIGRFRRATSQVSFYKRLIVHARALKIPELKPFIDKCEEIVKSKDV